MKNKRTKNGFMIIELIVGVAIATTVIIGIFTLMQISLRVSKASLDKTSSAYLLEEGVEAVKIIRDNDWTSLDDLVVGTEYHFLFSGGTWTLTTTPQTVGKYTRKVVFSDVYRDANDDIASSGTLDTNTLHATVTVSWTDSFGSSRSEDIVFYISNIFST